MALDVYVGSLARYYAGEWENIAEKAARERGVQYQIGRPGASADLLKDPERIPPAVLAWRSALSDSLVSKIVLPLDWDEALEAPYFTAGLGRLRFTCPMGGVCRASGAPPAGHPARGVGQRSRLDAQQRRGLSFAVL